MPSLCDEREKERERALKVTIIQKKMTWVMRFLYSTRRRFLHFCINRKRKSTLNWISVKTFTVPERKEFKKKRILNTGICFSNLVKVCVCLGGGGVLDIYFAYWFVSSLHTYTLHYGMMYHLLNSLLKYQIIPIKTVHWRGGRVGLDRKSIFIFSCENTHPQQCYRCLTALVYYVYMENKIL